MKLFGKKRNWGAFIAAVCIMWYLGVLLWAGIYALANHGIRQPSPANTTLIVLLAIPVTLAAFTGCMFFIYWLLSDWWNNRSVG